MVNEIEVLLTSDVEFGGRSFGCGEPNGGILTEPYAGTKQRNWTDALLDQRSVFC